MKKNEDQDLGAQSATEGDSAGSIAPDAAIARHTPTPGPWWAKADLFRPPKIFVHAPDSFAVCRVMTAHYHAEVAKANAHLIAAAPELLAALKQLKDRVGELSAVKREGVTGGAYDVMTASIGDDITAEFLEAEEAIAKAEGR